MAGIYEPSGRAKEFSQLALNLYDFCPHGCKYCYAAQVLHRSKEEFHKQGKGRVDPDSVAFHTDCARRKGDERAILLSFACDPYANLDSETQLTRRIIKTLKTYGLHFTVLTKAGELAQRDFDLYGPEDSFATTLTCDNWRDSLEWEPHAAHPAIRIANLVEAHRRKINTWVSFEPVLFPKQVMHLIEMTYTFVSHYKVGKLNYMEPPVKIDWKNFAERVIEKLNIYHCRFYIKADLAKYLGKEEGFWSDKE